MTTLYRNVLLVVCLILSGTMPSYAQTPVEDLILKYEDVRGARSFIATGAKMLIARSLILRTPVAPIADDVQELAVLKMQNVSQTRKNAFSKDLAVALKSYEYYGKADSSNGMVDVYVIPPSGGIVTELVIYNPEIYSLNSLKGRFTVEDLLQLRS